MDQVPHYCPPTHTIVQFCPCGHVYNIRKDDPRIQSQLADENKLDAPILSSKECEDCKEDSDERDRKNALADLDFFDNLEPVFDEQLGGV